MLPTSLYIHIPWCIRKCPYCDFNSHKSPEKLPEEEYINVLLNDFADDVALYQAREIQTIFIGGGTPSLFSAKAYETLFNQLQKKVSFAKDIEITLEANPGTVEQGRFNNYRKLGINRLSLGIQSFNPIHLKALGRIHDDSQAHKAVDAARKAGFDNINIDLMHGLPKQSHEEGLDDLKKAFLHEPEHISWYQLTIEPNTVFYKAPPVLPDEDELSLLEEQGFLLLAAKGYQRYEISAFSKEGKTSKHNLNYWLFGDYFGIGAGAHGKLSLDIPKEIYRTRKQRQPKDYLDIHKKRLAANELVSQDALVFEFMLNLSRLEGPIANNLFTKHTGLSFEILKSQFSKAIEKGFIELNESSWQVTPLGRRFTNSLQGMFLPD